MTRRFEIGDVLIYQGNRAWREPGTMPKKHKTLIEGRLYKVQEIVYRDSSQSSYDKIRLLPYDHKNPKTRYQTYSAVHFDLAEQNNYQPIGEVNKMEYKYVVVPVNAQYRDQHVGFETRQEAVEWITEKINQQKGPYRLFAALEDYSRPTVSPKVDPVDLSPKTVDDEQE